MTRFPFVQINPAEFLNFLVVDVDREDAELWLLHPAVPEPHWIIQNPANGHAQAGWMIDPVRRGPDAREHPIRYAESVQSALDELTGSDSNFTRFLVRNPVAHSPAGTVSFGSRIEPYTLGDLMSHMQNYEDPFEPDFTAWTGTTTKLAGAGRVRARAATGGRNNALFYATRAELWKRFTEQSLSPTKDYALSYAQAMNEQLPTPLPYREIRELSASAVRQVLKGQGKGLSSAPDPWLAEMGRKGGSASTESKRTAAEINARKATQSREEKKQAREVQARGLRAKGHTVETIASLLGKCIRTIKRYLAATSSKGDISQATGGCGAAPPGAASPLSRPPAPANPKDYPVTPTAPHDMSMLSKLRKVWKAAELNSEWATAHPAEAGYESIQARMDSVQKCCELAAQAINRRNNGYGDESVWLDELDMGPRTEGYAEGIRSSDIKTGLGFSTLDELTDYLRQVEPELFMATDLTEPDNQRDQEKTPTNP